MSGYSQQFLDERKKALLERRDKIMEDLRSFAHKNPEIPDDWETNFPKMGDDEDENAQEITLYINELPVEYTLESDLKNINAALRRIQKNTYGHCHHCKNSIDEKRLEAMPEAEDCINCAKNSSN